MTTSHYDIRVGEARVVRVPAPVGRFDVVFEDDGETAYVYVVARRRFGGVRILDALHIYDVDAVKDAHKTHRLTVHWSGKGDRAAVAINGYPHAAIDFAARRAGCRNASPQTSDWCQSSHAWDDSLVAFLTPTS